MQVAGVAWMRNRKLEIAEQPVDAEDVGMQHVRQEKISTLCLDWVACLVEEARMQSAAPGSANADTCTAAAKALRGDACGSIEDVPKTLQSQLGVEVASFSTFRKWERECFRQRKVIAAAASHSAPSSHPLARCARAPAPPSPPRKQAVRWQHTTRGAAVTTRAWRGFERDATKRALTRDTEGEGYADEGFINIRGPDPSTAHTRTRTHRHIHKQAHSEKHE